MDENFKNAKYWVGCSTESAEGIMFSFEAVMKNFASFCYVAAFDEEGEWVSEAKVIFDDEGTNDTLTFDF